MMERREGGGILGNKRGKGIIEREQAASITGRCPRLFVPA